MMDSSKGHHGDYELRSRSRRDAIEKERGVLMVKIFCLTPQIPSTHKPPGRRFSGESGR